MSDRQGNMIQEELIKTGSIEVDCIEITQPIGTFYTASISYKDLIEISYVDTRRIREKESSDEHDEIDSLLGIQRKLSPSREKELKQYVNTYDACFPTAIILSIPERCVEFDAVSKKMKISSYIDNDDPRNSVYFSNIASVLDGQHRIAGLQGYNLHSQPFELNISIFLELDSSSEAYIFSVVNQAQTKVNKSLVYDLYSLAKTRSPQKLCHQIAITLNDESDSPFEKKIKRLGSAMPDTKKVAITQAAFVQSLLKHISSPNSLAMQDRDLYMKGKTPSVTDTERDRMIFREMMIDQRDAELTAIIWNYFSAIRDTWPRAWNSTDQGIMLSKTNGFMAFMRYLKDVYLYLERGAEVVTIKEFKSVLSRVNLTDDDFTTDKFKPGTSGETALYRILRESII